MVPARIEVAVNNRTGFVSARVIWRDGCKIGIAFSGPTGLSSPFWPAVGGLVDRTAQPLDVANDA